MKRLALSLISVSLLLAPVVVKADSLSINLTQPFQTTVSPNTLAFDATIINNTGATLYLNGYGDNLDSPLKLDPGPFNSYPLTLGAGDSYTGVLFNIDVPSGLNPGLYSGNFEILGGPGGSDDNTIGTAYFNVDAPTPEPPSFLLLATGLAALGGAVLRRRSAGERSSAASPGV